MAEAAVTERLAAPETPESLAAEVDAIFADVELLYTLSTTGERLPEVPALRRAWAALTAEHRRLWRLAHDLDRKGRIKRGDIAAAIGSHPSAISKRLLEVRDGLTDHLWREGGFYGLAATSIGVKAQTLLHKFGIFNARQLLEKLQVLRREGWGASTYAELDAWLVARGHPSIAKRVRGTRRPKFR